MLVTTLVGGFLAGVYLLSGSLLAGVLIHALMDMHSGRLLHAAYAHDGRTDGSGGAEMRHALGIDSTHSAGAEPEVPA